MAFQRAVCWALKVVLSAAKSLRIGISWTEHCAQQLEDHLLLHSVGGMGCMGGRQHGIGPLPIGNKPPSPQVHLPKSVIVHMSILV